MVLIQIDFSFSSLYEWLNNVFGFCDNLLTKNVFYPLSGYKISAFLPGLVVQEAWLIAWKKYLDKKVTIFKDSDIENVQLAFWELFFCLNQWVFGKMTWITAFKSDWWGIYRESFISICCLNQSIQTPQIRPILLKITAKLNDLFPASKSNQKWLKNCENQIAVEKRRSFVV